MRVLMLAPRAPFPADHGAALRNLYLLRWLGERHEVTLVCFGDSSNQESHAELLRHAKRVEIVPFPHRSSLDRLRLLGGSIQPDLAFRLWSPAMIARLKALLNEQTFDVVQIEGLEMVALWEAARGRCQARLVLDEHNAEYVLQASAYRASRTAGNWPGAAYSWVQAGRLRRFERRALRAASRVITVSPEDAASLRTIAPDVSPRVIPNGVDTDYFRPLERVTTMPPTALFIGKLDYRPNLDALDWLIGEIWPRVRAMAPRARLLVVGRDPTPRIARAGGHQGIDIIGPVADEREWFARSDLLMVPMRMGGGVRLKVVQAMATGTPIVSTTAGMAGVGAVDGVHALIADSVEQFAARVVEAFNSSDLRATLARDGRILVVQRFDWRVLLPDLDELYASPMATP
ncbi:MAG TPA: glycosyltransferase family 4 protein [Chloroflexota bacterium]|nr:glycosyltransferase family 4 protein [Chloroflexota bacterium]